MALPSSPVTIAWRIITGNLTARRGENMSILPGGTIVTTPPFYGSDCTRWDINFLLLYHRIKAITFCGGICFSCMRRARQHQACILVTS